MLTRCVLLFVSIVTVTLCVSLSRVEVRAASGTANRDEWKALYHRPAEIPFPEDDPYSEAKDTLGRMLFFDPILSGSGNRSCANCHNPSLSWGDGLGKAVGEKQLPLRSPTLYNLAWSEILGWDGKFRGLESVAFAPITAPANMNRKEADLFAALAAIPGYQKAFDKAFPEDSAPNRRNIETALATFERTLVSGQAPFDRWIEGDEKAIGESAKRGFDLFNSKAGCAECHQGWNFTDGSFHDIGTAKGDDIGRARLFPTSVKLRYAFKVPTLRDVARRAPYMHDGSEPTLEAVIELYDRGGIDRPSRSELIKPLGLTGDEKADLIAFLKTLNEEPEPFVNPILPR
jgi:cytochrome c peroxidase